jgi:hypothetical protein
VDYDAVRDDVEALLQEFGSITQLRRTTGHSIDPATGAEVPGSTTSVDVSIVVLPMDSATSRALDTLGSLRAASRRIVLTCRDLVPRAGDELWLEGAWRDIPLLTPIAPDMGTSVLFSGAVHL